MLESLQKILSKLNQQLQTLKDKQEIPTKLDMEIVDTLNNEDNLFEEITQADMYHKGIDLAMIDIHDALPRANRANEVGTLPATESFIRCFKRFAA